MIKLPRLPSFNFPKINFLPKKPPALFLRIEKRIRFVLATAILSALVLFSTFFFFDSAWIFIPILFLAVYALGYFAILEGIEEFEWLTLFIVPVFFTISFYLFYFLFPVRWLTRLPFITLYAVSIYALLLTSNILNVGVEKSLQLYRAAFSVNFFYQTVIVFLISNILFSFRLNFFINGLVGGIAVFPLALQLFWTIKLNLIPENDLFLYALFTGIILGQIALVGSFIPFLPSILSLLMTGSYYSTAGLITAFIDSRLFKQTVREYLLVLGAVAIIALLTLNW